MTKTNTWLAGIFVAQLGALAVVWSSPATTDAEAERPLVAFNMATVKRVTITGRTTLDEASPPEPVTLAREGETWRIESVGGYPAQADKVDEVLSTLRGVRVRNPIGTSQGSHIGLGVADDAFTRRLTLAGPEGDTTLYLGAASGSAMHLRVAGDDRVYLHRGESAWSIGDQNNRYFDPIYLEADPESVDQLTVSNATGEHSMTRGEDGWRGLERETPQGVEQGEADALARSLLTVRMMEPVTREVTAAHGLDAGSRVSWTVVGDTTTRVEGYTIGAQADDQHHYVKSDASDWVVKVLSSSVSRALETDFSFLDSEAGG